MVDPWHRKNPPHLVGYESWLYQMPCIDSSGDLFVSVPLPGHVDLPGEPPNRWLVALGDISVKGETGKLNPHSTSISCIQSKVLHVPRSDIPERTQPSIRRTCTKPN